MYGTHGLRLSASCFLEGFLDHTLYVKALEDPDIIILPVYRRVSFMFP